MVSCPVKEANMVNSYLTSYQGLGEGIKFYLGSLSHMSLKSKTVLIKRFCELLGNATTFTFSFF